MTSPSMRLAIMQPYFLPYIGYFQLMAAVDKFVVFDDVHFINRGWINRNRLLLNGSAHTVTVPLRDAGQNRLICDIEIADEQDWRRKILRTVSQVYCKAPNYREAYRLIEHLIHFPTTHLNAFLLNSLRELAQYLSMSVHIVDTSRIYNNRHLKAQARILDICRLERATEYVNSIGGIDLYDKSEFAKHNVKLRFLQSTAAPYPQGTYEHVPNLSIVDVLMYNNAADVRAMLTKVNLV